MAFRDVVGPSSDSPFASTMLLIEKKLLSPDEGLDPESF
jgi:hypothetical protein